jgi:hypothetical protein
VSGRVRLVVVVCLVLVLATCGGDRAPESRATSTGSFVALAPDVYEPCGLQSAGAAVWVLGCSGGLVRVPRGSSAERATVPGDIAALDGLAGGEVDTVWALLASGEGTARRGSVARIDPESGTIVSTVALGTSIAVDAVVGHATLWVAASDGALYAVDGGEARRVSSGAPLMRVLADGTQMWTVAENGDVVARDPAGKPARTFAGVMPNAIGAAAGLGRLWLASADRGLVRLDPATGTVDRVAVSGTINAIEPCAGSVWISQPDAGLKALDAEGRVTKSVPLDIAPHYLACVSDRVVVVSEDGRIGTV